MKLTYRGVAYTLSSTSIQCNASAQTMIGKYRGVPCSVQQYSLPKQPQRFNLKYRGAYYYPDSIYPTHPGLATT